MRGIPLELGENEMHPDYADNIFSSSVSSITPVMINLTTKGHLFITFNHRAF